MKIVFTSKGDSWDSLVDPRFGRAEMFLVYDEQTQVLETIGNQETESMEHGVGLQSSKKILNIGTNIVITGNGAGSKALDILKTTGVEFYTGAGDMSIKDAYTAYKNNQLTKQF